MYFDFILDSLPSNHSLLLPNNILPYDRKRKYLNKTYCYRAWNIHLGSQKTPTKSIQKLYEVTQRETWRTEIGKNNSIFHGNCRTNWTYPYSYQNLLVLYGQKHEGRWYGGFIRLLWEWGNSILVLFTDDVEWRNINKFDRLLWSPLCIIVICFLSPVQHQELDRLWTDVILIFVSFFNLNFFEVEDCFLKSYVDCLK